MSPSALFPSIPAFSQGVKKFEKLLFLSTLLSFQLLINYSLSSSTMINWSKKHACCSRHYFVQSKFSIPVNSNGLANNVLSHWSWFFLKVKKKKRKLDWYEYLYEYQYSLCTMKYFAIRSELSETDWSPHLHGANNLTEQILMILKDSAKNYCFRWNGKQTCNILYLTCLTYSEAKMCTGDSSVK